MEHFKKSLHHLFAELERIDLLIAAQVTHARQLYSQDDEFRGLYIPETEVDALLTQPLGRPRWAQEQRQHQELIAQLEKISRQINQRKAESLDQDIELRLHNLEDVFGLDRFEIDSLLVSLAVELDLRYERLYAYLQDDVTKKQPSIDLVLNLLTPTAEAKFDARRYFTADAPLLRNHLVELRTDPSQTLSPLIARYLKVDSRIVQYLLGVDEIDERIEQHVCMRRSSNNLDTTLLVVDKAVQSIESFIRSCKSDKAIFYLHGPYGVGKQATAQAVCDKLGLGLLVADIEGLVSHSNSSLPLLLLLIQREARLQNAAVYWKGFDILLAEKNRSFFDQFILNLRDRPALTFITGELLWEPADELRGAAFARIEMPRTNLTDRARIWAAVFHQSHLEISDSDISAIATKFKFTGGQILDAAATVENLTRQRNPESAEILQHDLYEACRLHSNQKLATLARKISPQYKWTDIVLPAERLEQLREICNHLVYRDLVYGEWGFDSKLALGKGLSVLFTGPSGTGKTMAAEIIAGELGLELYKIDLSTVVSKYIGETEKNLSKIFAEAETSNAILFFDEADALFGKRSEVKDSHDRYANIETGYLLQRMEEYEGVVILATNLRKNMDEAFVRRLQFTVEFPFPGKVDRLRIWEKIWPIDTPRGINFDVDSIARRFEITGGNIRNIALASAFLAADDGGVVNMIHLLRATRREYQKMGKVMEQDEFEEDSLAVV